MPKSMKQSDESASAMEGGVNGDDASPPVYGLPPGSASDVGGNADNNFLNGVGWPAGAAARDEAAAGGTAPPAAPSAPQTSSFTAAALVAAALLFLLANVVAFAFIFYQRGKLRVRENLFRNRFRCKTVSVPDLFDENESGDIYAYAAAAAAEKRRLGDGDAGRARYALRKSKNGRRRDKATASKKGRGGGAAATAVVDFEGGRVASVKPEAMSGKRMRRWPLSRQCSGSTITVDAHSKVRDWIVNEVATVAAAARGATPRFSRKSAAKKRAEAGLGASVDDEAGAIEMRTIERHRRGPPAGAAAAATTAASSSPLKISVAVDATPAKETRMDGVLATQMPVRMVGSAGVAPSYALGGGGEDDDDDDDGGGGGGDRASRNAACTHKSSAHIRLKTPQFLLETSPPTWHSHSRSDPSPVGARPAAAATTDDALYSRVDKSRKSRRLESFAGSGGSDSESEREGWGCGLATSPSRHYEEINVTSRPDVDADGAHGPPSAQQTLRNLVRRNFPKVLPDVARVQQKRAYRSSLPAGGAAKMADGCADCYANVSGGRSGRLPPAPPPRVTSTLGRRPTPHSSAETAAAADAEHEDDGDDDGDGGTQLSRITVRLQRSAQPRIAEETGPDIVQTESCRPPRPPPLPAVAALCPSRAPPASDAATSAAVEESWRKKTKEVRSVTTSTTGIS